MIGSNILFSSVKPAKKVDLILSCVNSAEFSRFEELATEKISEKYKVAHVPLPHARIRIVELSEMFTEDINIDQLEHHRSNNGLFMSEDNCKLISIKSH